MSSTEVDNSFILLSQLTVLLDFVLEDIDGGVRGRSTFSLKRLDGDTNDQISVSKQPFSSLLLRNSPCTSNFLYSASLGPSNPRLGTPSDPLPGLQLAFIPSLRVLA